MLNANCMLYLLVPYSRILVVIYNVDIKNLTKEQAKKIYHQDYWRRAKCDEVPSHLDISILICV